MKHWFVLAAVCAVMAAAVVHGEGTQGVMRPSRTPWLAERDCPSLCDSACECRATSNCLREYCNGCLVSGVPCGTSSMLPRFKEEGVEGGVKDSSSSSSSSNSTSASDSSSEEKKHEEAALKVLEQGVKHPTAAQKEEAAEVVKDLEKGEKPQTAKEEKALKALQGAVSTSGESMSEMEKEETAAAKEASSVDSAVSTSGESMSEMEKEETAAAKEASSVDSAVSTSGESMSEMEKEETAAAKEASSVDSKKPVTHAELAKVLSLQRYLIKVVAKGQEKMNARLSGFQFPSHVPSGARALAEGDSFEIPHPFGENTFTKRLHRGLGTHELLAYVNGKLVPVVLPGRESQLKQLVHNLEKLVAWVRAMRASGSHGGTQAQILNSIVAQAARLVTPLD